MNDKRVVRKIGRGPGSREIWGKGWRQSWGERGELMVEEVGAFWASLMRERGRLPVAWLRLVVGQLSHCPTAGCQLHFRKALQGPESRHRVEEAAHPGDGGLDAA